MHCTAWQDAYRGIVCDRYLDTMTVEATTVRARNFPDNTLVAKDKDKGRRICRLHDNPGFFLGEDPS